MEEGESRVTTPSAHDVDGGRVTSGEDDVVGCQGVRMAIGAGNRECFVRRRLSKSGRMSGLWLAARRRT